MSFVTLDLFNFWLMRTAPASKGKENDNNKDIANNVCYLFFHVHLQPHGTMFQFIYDNQLANMSLCQRPSQSWSLFRFFRSDLFFFIEKVFLLNCNFFSLYFAMYRCRNTMSFINMIIISHVECLAEHKQIEAWVSFLRYTAAAVAVPRFIFFESIISMETMKLLKKKIE